MEFVLPGLITVFILLFLLRRHIKPAAGQWTGGKVTPKKEDLAEIIAREKKRILACPQCQSKVVTPTGYREDTVACGNCGTEILVPNDPLDNR